MEDKLRKTIKRQNLIIIFLSVVIFIFSAYTIIQSYIQYQNLKINADCLNKGMCIKTTGIFNECVDCQELEQEKISK